MIQKCLTGLTVTVLLVFTRTTDQKPLMQRMASGSYKSCLLECLSCVELWGTIYDGNACANGCALSDGKSIDTNCEHGVNVGKRFEKLKAEDDCKKQCSYCVNELSKIHYNGSKCVRACAENAVADTECRKHLNWYDMFI